MNDVFCLRQIELKYFGTSSGDIQNTEVQGLQFGVRESGQWCKFGVISSDIGWNMLCLWEYVDSEEIIVTYETLRNSNT